MNTFELKQAAIRSVEGILGTSFDATSQVHGALVKGFIEGANYAMCKPKVITTKKWTIDYAKEVIIEVVSEHYKISLEEMKKNSRKTEVRFPRQVLSSLLRDIADLGLVATARLFHQDHATVIHSQTVIAKRLITDPSFVIDYSIMISEINKRCELLQIQLNDYGSNEGADIPNAHTIS